MLNKIISLYKSFYVNAPKKHRREFAEKLRTDNIARLKVMSLFVLSLIPFMALAHFEIIKLKYCKTIPFYCETLFGAHYAAVSFSIIYLIVYRFANPRNWKIFFCGSVRIFFHSSISYDLFDFIARISTFVWQYFFLYNWCRIYGCSFCNI